MNPEEHPEEQIPGYGEESSIDSYVGETKAEYGTAFKSGDMTVWHSDGFEYYPLSKKIANERHSGGHVYRRLIMVIEDWKEVAAP